MSSYLEYQNQKLKEVLLYILGKTGSTGYFRLMKILFCSDRQNLLLWGDPVTNLEYYAWKHGPVPISVCNELRAVYQNTDSDFSDILSVEGNFMIVHAMRKPDLSYLSETDKESINKAIDELAGMNRRQIENYLHESVYHRILGSDHKKYSHIDIVMSAGASKKQIDHVRYEDQLTNALA